MDKYHKKEYKSCIPKIGKHRVIDREIVNVSHFNQPQIVVAMPHQIVAMPRQIVAIHRHT